MCCVCVCVYVNTSSTSSARSKPTQSKPTQHRVSQPGLPIEQPLGVSSQPAICGCCGQLVWLCTLRMTPSILSTTIQGGGIHALNSTYHIVKTFIDLLPGNVAHSPSLYVSFFHLSCICCTFCSMTSCHPWRATFNPGGGLQPFSFM